VDGYIDFEQIVGRVTNDLQTN